MINIITPEKNAIVSLLTSVQKSFIEDIHLRETAEAEAFDYLNLIATKENKTDPEPVRFSWESDGNVKSFRLEISVDEDFTSKIEFCTDASEVSVYILLAGEKYYFRITDGTSTSRVQAFYTELATDQSSWQENAIAYLRSIGVPMRLWIGSGPFSCKLHHLSYYLSTQRVKKPDTR